MLLLVPTTNVFAMGDFQSQGVRSPLINKPSPDLVLTNTEGKTDPILSSRQGKKAVVIFWATWCPHCYEELGQLNDNIANIEQKGIKIILVDIGETTTDVKDYFKRRQMRLISFVDEDSSVQEPYHIVGVPTLIFIDEKGMVRNVTHQFPSDYESYFK